MLYEQEKTEMKQEERKKKGIVKMIKKKDE